MKPLIVFLIVLWIGLIYISAINMLNQYQVNKQYLEIVKLYKIKAELNPKYKREHDALNSKIVNAEKLSKQLVKPYPLKNVKQNWLLLRLSIISLSVISGVILFLQYRKYHLQ